MTGTFVQEFASRSGTATADGPEWLEPVRRAAMERFAATGFPAARAHQAPSSSPRSASATPTGPPSSS